MRHPFTKIFSNLRQREGAMMGLVGSFLLILTSLGIAFFYCLEFISGDKEVMNDTDLATVAAAHQICGISLTLDEVKKIPNIPQQFLSLGVNADGSVDADSSTAIFDERWYNNAAASTTLTCFSAATDGSKPAIDNANATVAALNLCAAALNNKLKDQTSSAYPGNAASGILQNNLVTNLPFGFFNQPSHLTQVANGSMKFGYHDGASNVAFSSAIAATIKPAWLAKISSTTQSSNGSYYLNGNTAYNMTDVTGVPGFTGYIALAALPQQAHLITQNSFSTNLPSMTVAASNGILPCNSVTLQGQFGESQGGNNNNNNNQNGSPQGGNSSNNNFILTAVSAAVAGAPGQIFNIPGTTIGTTSGSGTTTGTTTDPAFVAIFNGPDFVSNSGYTTAQLQQLGYSNIDLTANTPIAFDHSQPNIFDLIGHNGFVNHQYCGVIIATDSTGHDYDLALNPSSVLNNINPNLSPQVIFNDALLAACNSQLQNFPATNYGGNISSIPFLYTTANPTTGDVTPAINDIQSVIAWAKYNRSKGKAQNPDTIGRESSLDPLINSGGSPALFNQNPNALVPGTSIKMGPGAGAGVTIAQALNIQDFVFWQDQKNPFAGPLSNWMYNLMSTVASNLGIAFTPTPLGETRPNGYTCGEYAKAQITCTDGALGLFQNPCIQPCTRGTIYLPGFVSSLPSASSGPYSQPIESYLKGCSGLRYWPLDSNGKITHFSWPDQTNHQYPEASTPLKLIENINIMNNNGTLNLANDLVLNQLLRIVQQMNSNITMANLTAALDTFTLDLGQSAYLIYDSNQQQLVMVNSLPSNMTYQPPDMTNSWAYDTVTYKIAGQTSQYGPGNLFDGDTGSLSMKTLLDTTAAPNSTISDNGQNVSPAPYGDNMTAIAPYRVLDTNSVALTDMAALCPGTGSNCNHGEVHFRQTITSQQLGSPTTGTCF